MEGELRLAGPARAVPWSARLRFLFGGFHNQAGWMTLGLGILAASPPRDRLLAVGWLGAGFFNVGYGLYKGLRGVRLLRHGVVTEGRFVDKGLVREGKSSRWELTYSFVTLEGEERVLKARTKTLTDFETRGPQPIVYDPANPNNAIALDDLPGRPRLGEDAVELRGGGWTVPWLLLPATVLVSALAVLARLVR